MAGIKGKYMPLSEANVSPVMVSEYDGQYIYVNGGNGRSYGVASATSSHGMVTLASSAAMLSSSTMMMSAADGKSEVRYIMGNYLGGGIAGVVYEAYDQVHHRHVAIKILNPVGYKLCSPSALRRAEIIKKGVPVMGNLRGMTMENVYWVKVPTKRDLIACYVDGRSVPNGGTTAMGTNLLRELTLEMCVSLWMLDGDEDEEELIDELMMDDDDDPTCRVCQQQQQSSSPSHHVPTRNSSGRADVEMKREDGGGSGGSSSSEMMSGITEDEDVMMMMMMTTRRCVRGCQEQIQVGDVVYTIPRLPAKYRTFLQSRRTIYREIAHMHKLTGNSVSGNVGNGHPNVLKLYDVLERIQPSKSTIFLVLELASGGELFDRIRQEHGVEETIARTYFRQLLSGVLFCHQLGIVHRDLKPENLLLSDTEELKIADFGLSAHFIAAVSSGGAAAIMGDGPSSSAATASQHHHHHQRHQPVLPEMDEDDTMGMTTTSTSGSSVMIPVAARFRRLNSVVGSPHYVAPEILQNARYGYDGRKADMWSIGVILYSMLAGSLPFGKELQTCPRYLKFCEWIRSLPCDPQTGRLVYDTTVYQSGSALAMRMTTPTEDDEDLPGSRMAQVHPNFNGSMPTTTSNTGSGNGNGWRNPQPLMPIVSVVKTFGNDTSSGSHHGASVLPNGAGSSRRGSRVVSFPTWLFPARVSPEAVFLMASLLHPEAGKRMSCQDANRSAWVAGHPL